MKRRYIQSTILLVLTIASFLLLNSCGIPTYLYLDTNSLDVAINDPTDPTILDVTLTLTDDAYRELKNKYTTPSIKLFYAYSTSPTTGVQVRGSIITLENAADTFNSLYRNNNKGRAFSIGRNEAPALYLYRKDIDSTTITSSTSRFEYDKDLKIDALVLGTFSTRLIIQNDDNDFFFNGAPEMDFTVPLSTFSDTLEGKQATFTLTIDSNGEYTEILLDAPPLGSNPYYLGDYKKNRFLGKASTKEAFKNQLNNQDPETFEVLIDELDGPIQSLYIHLWASLFGGEGEFNNIVWSPLQYIGEIELYNETP